MDHQARQHVIAVCACLLFCVYSCVMLACFCHCRFHNICIKWPNSSYHFMCSVHRCRNCAL